MVDKIKLKVKLVDKHKIFPMKAEYDPQTRIGEVKRGLRKTIAERFHIDPDDIYEEFSSLPFVGDKRKEYVVYVDNASRKSVTVQRVKEIIEDGKKKTEAVTETVDCARSVTLHNGGDVDQKERNKLNYLTQQSFWKSLMEKRKLPVSTVLLILFAGMGIYHVVRMIFQIMGYNV